MNGNDEDFNRNVYLQKSIRTFTTEESIFLNVCLSFKGTINKTIT